jgi:hypothetical protein
VSVIHEPAGRAQRRGFRNRGMIAVSAINVGFFAGGFVTYGFLNRAVGAKVFMWVLGGAGAWLFVRILRSGIFVWDWGLEVRGWRSTHRAAWADVAGFRQVSASALNSSVCLAVEVVDGSRLKTSGMTSATDGTFGDVALRELIAVWHSAH